MKLGRNAIIGLLLGLLVIIGGAGVFYVSYRTSQQESIAPTAPQSQPIAGSCSLEFTITTPP
ncbi:hypothetical protein KBD71_03200 [Candidatus Woesebacteria bacterium]|nr:hypothetical protein [Candidatus Woesebacteria bacterium]